MDVRGEERDSDGKRSRLRYIGITCPERGEPFSAEATRANELLVLGTRGRHGMHNVEPGLTVLLFAHR